MSAGPTPYTPREVFERWLEQQPDSARVVVACDTDRLLVEDRALDQSVVTDPTGRAWHLAVFRGDDLRFRLAFRKASTQDRIAIVVIGSPDSERQLDVSTIGDVLGRHEGTAPLDLSLARYLGRFCPQINFPPAPIRHYKIALLARTRELSAAAKKITARWGKPDDWGRPQVAALVLLAHAPHSTSDCRVVTSLTPSREVDPAGTLRAVSFRLRHTTIAGEMRESVGGQVTVPVQVKPKANVSKYIKPWLCRVRRKGNARHAFLQQGHAEAGRHRAEALGLLRNRSPNFDGAEASISVLKDYMQTGKFGRGDQEFSASCSIVLGGNIDTDLENRARRQSSRLCTRREFTSARNAGHREGFTGSIP